MVTQDIISNLRSKRRAEYLFGRTKTGDLGQVSTKKRAQTKQEKTRITRPRPDCGLIVDFGLQPRMHKIVTFLVGQETKMIQ